MSFWKLKIWMPHFYLSSPLNNNFRSEQAGFPWKNNTYDSFTLNTLMKLSLNRWHSLRDRENCIIIVLVNPHVTTLNADKNHNGTYMSFLLPFYETTIILSNLFTPSLGQKIKNISNNNIPQRSFQGVPLILTVNSREREPRAPGRTVHCILVCLISSGHVSSVNLTLAPFYRVLILNKWHSRYFTDTRHARTTKSTMSRSQHH